MLGGSDPYFHFTSEDEKRKWEGVADAIWEEYVEVLKEYFETLGIKQYILPEKPKWTFEVKLYHVF
jgi:hypothetical protein